VGLTRDEPTTPGPTCWPAWAARVRSEGPHTAAEDIDQIMEDAKDLVTVDHTLRQILNVKGD
jgi:hypothetical protein